MKGGDNYQEFLENGIAFILLIVFIANPGEFHNVLQLIGAILVTYLVFLAGSNALKRLRKKDE